MWFELATGMDVRNLGSTVGENLRYQDGPVTIEWILLGAEQGNPLAACAIKHAPNAFLELWGLS